MRVRRLNEVGIDRLLGFLDSLTDDLPQARPDEILSDAATSDEVNPAVEVESRAFGSRFEAAKYLSEKFEHAGLRRVRHDRGLWAWLSLFYFDELCPAGRHGRRKPGENARWVLEPTVFRGYRQLLAGPYVIFRAYRDEPERALAVLCQPLDKPGDVVAQLASRQDFLMNRAMMEAATHLYVDPVTRKLKPGAQTRGKGSTLRLVDVINQFDVTWDLYQMSAPDLLACYPTSSIAFAAKCEPRAINIDG